MSLLSEAPKEIEELKNQFAEFKSNKARAKIPASNTVIIPKTEIPTESSSA